MSECVRPRFLRFAAAIAALIALNVTVMSQGRGGPPPSVDLPVDLEQVRGRPAAAREVLVQFREQVPASEIAQLGLQVDAEEREDLVPNGIMRLRSRRFDVETLTSFLATLPFVEFAEPNYLLSIDNTPNDPQWPKLWGLQNGYVWSAWKVTTGSTGYVVGVVDSGVDYNHPDLKANMWTAPAAFTVTVAGKTISCAAGTRGFNAIANTCYPMDDHNHGTHVAGTIGATGNNATGVVGMNWKTRIMALKFIGSNGSGTTSNAIKAIEFAIQAKQKFAASKGANVRVLSNSWGGGSYSQALLNQINKAGSNDMLFVAAAGNKSQNTDVYPHYPSSYDAANIISVAAITSTEYRASFSNYGRKTVDLGAPGAGILSTVRNKSYASYSGTSMATPHVTGAAALVLSACPMSTSSLKNTLLSTVKRISSLSNITVTGGRLHVNGAILNCLAN